MLPEIIGIESYAFLDIKNMQKHIKTPSGSGNTASQSDSATDFDSETKISH